MLSAYPLAWPVGWKRTPSAAKVHGKFGKRESSGTNDWKMLKDVTVTEATSRILQSLSMMGIDRQDVIISTNVKLRLDGLPRSGEKEPDDVGAAVYWQKAGKPPMRSMAIDRYWRVADNLAAIAATLEAMRAIERHGGAEILDRTFTGFAALPAQATQAWREVLGLHSPDVTREQVETRAKALMRMHHPDAGGDRDEFEKAVEARTQALAEIA